MRGIRSPGLILAVLCVMCSISYFLFLSPPKQFPRNTTFTVEKGATLSSVIEGLVEGRFVSHPTVLKVFWKLTGGDDRVQAGTYLFTSPQNVLTIGMRLTTGAYGVPPVKVTFPEGLSVREMAKRVSAAFPDISESAFLEVAKSNEGYLFPDTYLFSSVSDAQSIVSSMRKNFDEKIASLEPDIRASGHSVTDVVIMASLLEKEARTFEVRRTVAGILWDRLALGMPLQTDAVFGYIFDRDTYSPTFEDLKIKSPYNTYTHVGLPPTPINNPGLDALRAAVMPIKTPYLYYLVDKNGVIHYARTYAEHLTNQNQYLK